MAEDKLISARYGKLFQVHPDAVHGDRDFREHAKNRLNFYEKLLKRMRAGMGEQGFMPSEIDESESKVKQLINHWAGILETLGGI